MFLSVEVTDLDWNVVLWMWWRITQTLRVLRAPSVVCQENWVEEDERL
jgi:hypothetical protein